MSRGFGLIGSIFLFSLNGLGKSYLNDAVSSGYEEKVEIISHGVSTTVVDLSGLFEEAPAVSKPGIKTVNAASLFRKNQFFFAFGIPNVFMGIVGDDGTSVTQIAAKSLWRESLKIGTNSRGTSQSGVYLLPLNLPQEALRRVQEIALISESEEMTGITCLNQILRILDQAGFSLKSGKLTNYIFPHSFLKEIVSRGLLYQPEDAAQKPVHVQFDVVKTTSQSLNSFYNQIWWAQVSTPWRHAERSCDTEEKRSQRLEAAREIAGSNLMKYEELQAIRDQKPDETSDAEVFPVSIGQPSYLGSWARSLWGDHLLFRMDLSEHSKEINHHLPEILKAFPMDNPGKITQLKKHVLFARGPVRFINYHRAGTMVSLPPQSVSSVIRMLRTHPLSDGSSGKYNYVLTGRSLSIARITVQNRWVDWVMCKHLAISNYSGDVRISGELWKSPDGVIHLNNDSGTYMPGSDLLPKLSSLLSGLFPGISFVVESAAGVENVSEETEIEVE